MLTAISPAIPRAFTGDGVAFAVAYLLVVWVHSGLYVGAAAWPTLCDVLGFARFNAAAAMLILAAAVAGAGRYAFWVAAVAVITVTPSLLQGTADPISASHFVDDTASR